MKKKNFLERILKKKNFFILIVILSVIFEILYVKFNVDAFKVICGVSAAAFSLVLLPIMRKVAKDTLKQEEQKAENKQSGIIVPGAEASSNNIKDNFQDVLDRACQFASDGYLLAKKNSLVCFIVVLAILLCVPAASAHYRVTGKIVDLFMELGTDDKEELAETAAESDIKTDKDDENPPENFANHPFLTNPDKYFELLKDEQNRLYFQTGEYVITDWSDIEEVTGIINRYVYELRCFQIPNRFDNEASEDIKGEVAEASKLEREMINSDDLDKVINARVDAWHQYPKSVLSTLLAANQQRYALEYIKADGNFKTIEYYYAHSIFWLWESLKFSDVDEYMKKSILASIEMRYHDIAEVAPDGSSAKYYASVLSEAFKCLENQ